MAIEQYPHLPCGMLIATLWVAISIPQGKWASPSHKAQYAKNPSSLGLNWRLPWSLSIIMPAETKSCVRITVFCDPHVQFVGVIFLNKQSHHHISMVVLSVERKFRLLNRRPLPVPYLSTPGHGLVCLRDQWLKLISLVKTNVSGEKLIGSRERYLCIEGENIIKIT